MIGHRLYLDLKIVLTTKSFFFFLFFVPFLGMMFLTVIAPAQYAMQVVIVWTAMIMTSTTYYQISGNYRNSSLYKNSNLNKHDKFTTNLANVLISVSAAYVSLVVIIAMTEICSAASLLVDDWPWIKFLYKMQFSFSLLTFDEWVLLLWSELEVALIICGLGFMMFRLFESPKVFFIIVLSISILQIIFGGIFNNYFALNENTSTGLYVPTLEGERHHNLFPFSFFLPSLLFPLYSSSQHIAVITNRVGLEALDGTVLNWNPWIWLNNLNVWEGAVKVFRDIWSWNILWFLPWAWTLLFLMVGVAKEKIA